jgi:hypothetical protein
MTNNLYLGPTAFKHRILRGLGWKVISIPYFEWAELETMRQKQVHRDTNANTSAHTHALPHTHTHTHTNTH